MIRRLFHARETALFLVLIFLFVGFSIFVNGFCSGFNLLERSRYWVAPGMIAVPMTFIIATAGIDLSVASLVALCGITLGLLYRDLGWPIGLAAAAAVSVGTLAGAFNGGVSSFLKIPPLVVTLATMTLFRGIAMGLSKGNPIRNLPAGFTWLSQGDAFRIPAAQAGPIGFPVPLIALAITVAVGALLLRKSWIGRFTECIGENAIASEFAAINVGFMKFGIYTACGFICGLASLFHTALYATAKADTAMGMELDVIACVVVGGTRISGGQATMVGTLLGLLIIGVLKYGLDMAGIDPQLITILVGVLVIAAAVLNERVSGYARMAQRGARTGSSLSTPV